MIVSQKFIIAPDIGGFNLGSDAALYLDWNHFRKQYEGKYCYFSDSDKKSYDDMYEFAKQMHKDNSGIFFWEGDSGCFQCNAYTFWGNTGGYSYSREYLIPVFESLEYKYEKLDELNGTMLRMVEVPGDAPVRIASDEENGYEFIEEKHKFYPGPNDAEQRMMYLVAKYFAKNAQPTDGNYQFEEVTISIDGKHGIVRGEHGYMFIQRNEYVDRVVYEPVYFGYLNHSFFTPPVERCLITPDEFEVLRKLVGLVPQVLAPEKEDL